MVRDPRSPFMCATARLLAQVCTEETLAQVIHDLFRAAENTRLSSATRREAERLGSELYCANPDAGERALT